MGLAGARRYRTAPLHGVPVGFGDELVSSPLTGGSEILPGPTLALLERCRGFATLDEHAAACGGELGLGGEQIEALRDELEALEGRGFLISREWLLDRCQASLRAEAPPPPIATLGIVTCGRPEALPRGLASHLAGVRVAGRSVDIAVVDDTREAPAREAARSLLRGMGHADGAGIRYAGREEKARFAEAIVRETGVSPGVVEFALFDPEACGLSTGANRNALLLDTVGDMVLSVDDDVLWRVARMPGAEAGLTLASGAGPVTWRFYPDRTAARAAVRFGDVDLLAAHERLLGRSPGACLAAAAAGAEVDLDELGPDLLSRLAGGRGRVLLTMTGRVGDLAMTDPVVLDLPGESLARAVATRADYRTACTSREALHGATRTTISDGAPCSSLALGLDNREGLPPFFPVFRGQDLVFGRAVRRCLTSACAGLLPLVVLHEPLERRVFEPDDVWRRWGGFALRWLVIDCLESWPPPPGPLTGAAALRALGAHLQRLAGLPRRGFREMAREARWRRVGSRIQSVERRFLERRREPAHWAGDVQRHLAVLRAALVADIAPPADLAPGRSPEEAWTLAQRLVRQYGEVVAAWPDLLEGARRLRGRGVRLAPALGAG